MRRVQELPTGKKISRYPGLKSQDPRIYVQKKGSAMRRVQELPTGKKNLKIPISRYLHLCAEERIHEDWGESCSSVFYPQLLSIHTNGLYV
jgi:3-phenylpropionate/cinnamic acid dioxygenase small subunit